MVERPLVLSAHDDTDRRKSRRKQVPAFRNRHARRSAGHSPQAVHRVHGKVCPREQELPIAI
jgi:hypothetical protein